MKISIDPIIERMISELNQAKLKKNDPTALKEHLSNIQLMCELILADENMPSKKNPEKTPHFTEKELQMMMGKQAVQSQTKENQSMKKTIHPEKKEEPSDWIFDF